MRCTVLFSFCGFRGIWQNNDSGVLNNSKIWKLFKRDKRNIPNPGEIEITYVEISYFLVGDEIFPLVNWLMGPFSEKALTNANAKSLTTGYSESVEL